MIRKETKRTGRKDRNSFIRSHSLFARVTSTWRHNADSLFPSISLLIFFFFHLLILRQSPPLHFPIRRNKIHLKNVSLSYVHKLLRFNENARENNNRRVYSSFFLFSYVIFFLCIDRSGIIGSRSRISSNRIFNP